jgi:hypothetical protein
MGKKEAFHLDVHQSANASLSRSFKCGLLEESYVSSFYDLSTLQSGVTPIQFAI